MKPIILTEQSVPGALQWQDYEFQPAALNVPTSWASSSLPTGLSMNAGTGKITGAATTPGITTFGVVATNGDGDSDPVYFTIGIEPASDAAPSTLTEIEIELATGEVTSAGSGGGAIVFAKRGDDLVFQVAFKKGGVVADLDLTELKFALKQFEPENVVVESDEWVKTGTGQAARYQVHVSFIGTALSAALSDYEDDAATQFKALGEFEFIETNPFEVGPATLRHTSATFAIGAVRDLIPDA